MFVVWCFKSSCSCITLFQNTIELFVFELLFKVLFQCFTAPTAETKKRREQEVVVQKKHLNHSVRTEELTKSISETHICFFE